MLIIFSFNWHFFLKGKLCFFLKFFKKYFLKFSLNSYSSINSLIFSFHISHLNGLNFGSFFEWEPSSEQSNFWASLKPCSVNSTDFLLRLYFFFESFSSKLKHFPLWKDKPIKISTKLILQPKLLFSWALLFNLLEFFY